MLQTIAAFFKLIQRPLGRLAVVSACIAFATPLALAQTGETLTVKRPTDLRAGPGDAHPALANLAAQTPLARQTGRLGAWVEVKDNNGRSGWVHMFDVSGASASGSGGTAASALRGITSLFGRSPVQAGQSGGGTSTVGIRGMRAEDLAAARPDLNAVLMMETLRLDPAQAQSFGAESQLQVRPVADLPAPPTPSTAPTVDPMRDRP